jgi:hypothetical protein
MTGHLSAPWPGRVHSTPQVLFDQSPELTGLTDKSGSGEKAFAVAAPHQLG